MDAKSFLSMLAPLAAFAAIALYCNWSRKRLQLQLSQLSHSVGREIKQVITFEQRQRLVRMIVQTSMLDAEWAAISTLPLYHRYRAARDCHLFETEYRDCAHISCMSEDDREAMIKVLAQSESFLMLCLRHIKFIKALRGHLDLIQTLRSTSSQQTTAIPSFVTSEDALPNEDTTRLLGVIARSHLTFRQRREAVHLPS